MVLENQKNLRTGGTFDLAISTNGTCSGAYKLENATLRGMQALLAAQTQLLRAQHMRVPQEQLRQHQLPPWPRQSPQHRRSYAS
jgi:uncharacterized protein YfaT (DUF1175 family)